MDSQLSTSTTASTASTITVHRTAVFPLHQPTRHTRAALEAAFRLYTRAYTEVLHACQARYTPDALRGLATYELKDGKLRQSARTLDHHLFGPEADPALARTYRAVAAPLESRLRQSLREHVGQTLMSYLALADAHATDSTRGGAPAFPSRLRAFDVARTQMEALAGLADPARVAADPARMRASDTALVNRLLATAQPDVVSIPFVGLAPEYGCGLYYQEATGRFYARLDVVGNGSHLGRAITARGVYRDLKTGVAWVASGGEPIPDGGAQTFGRGKKSVLVLLGAPSEHDHTRWRGHGSILRAALQPEHLTARLRTPANEDSAPVPVSAKLVRRVRPAAYGRGSEITYALHVSFEITVAAPNERNERNERVADEATRPLLAVNRGLYQFAAWVLTTPDGLTVTAVGATSGRVLMATQVALERERAARQVRGVTGARERHGASARDRRQARIADEHLHLCARQIVDAAMAAAGPTGAQIVMEDLAAFASGHALRGISARPAARRATLRRMLNRRQFERLRALVNERLELAGLPPVRVVSAAYISQTCPACGQRNTSRSDGAGAPAARAAAGTSDRRFTCASCGWSADTDVTAAANIARKLAWLRVRGEEKRAGVSEGERTPWEAFARAHPVHWMNTER